ncbi:hypothetical protein Micbo1qcDRAFT_203590 [Microdochium bolleyi]|uniref:Berberine/berberine-like domain-containing protein n=1 Tax=Microdochium bolleyi TaxID=196109 RepID=A0A136J8L1_9PEZI|nr:hypothetical protein Micbo1qcDRAFT_203590 [Microdochium bolleyi]
MHKRLPEAIDDRRENNADLLKFRYAMVVVWAQWVNIPGEPAFLPALFDEILSGPNDSFNILKASPEGTPMSHIASMWLMGSSRDFADPYVKRTYLTRPTSPCKDGWMDWFMQVYSGKNSMLSMGVGNGTAYCNRYATIVGTWDVFYSKTKEAAEAKEDRRLLWDSWGDWNMKNVRQHYRDEATYRKVQRIRKIYEA